MESRIKVEVDFDNGNRPVIEIAHKGSDDVRDKLLKHFLESVGGNCWCRIVFLPSDPSETAADQLVHIRPIHIEQMLNNEMDDLHGLIYGEMTFRKSHTANTVSPEKIPTGGKVLTNGELVKQLIQLDPNLPVMFIDLNNDSEDAPEFQVQSCEENIVTDEGGVRRVVSLLSQPAPVKPRPTEAAVKKTKPQSY